LAGDAARGVRAAAGERTQERSHEGIRTGAAAPCTPRYRRVVTAATTVPVRVWDLPTRLCHWALAVCVVGAVVSAKIGGDAMAWHVRFGHAVLALLAFRLLWGFVGGRWSRFASFVHAPATLWRYLRRRASPDERLDVGHSPLGALSVFALLAVLAAQAGTGLFADDEIAWQGPLWRFVDADTASAATGWHAHVGQWLVLALVALHVAAIAVYRWRGKRLVGAMVGGDKLLPRDVPPSRDDAATRGLALALALACAAGAAGLAAL
jgi:cytochrome b